MKKKCKLSEKNNALRFIKLNGFIYEKISTFKTELGWMHTLKMPYTSLETKSRYKDISDQKLKELLNNYKNTK
jgi:hypothetical protein